MIVSFWSPCLVYDIEQGCHVIAFYTIAASMVMITFTVYMMSGGDSTELYFPFFEADVRDDMIGYGGLVVLYFLFMIGASFMLAHGVKTSLRGWMIPWLAGMAVCIVFQIYWSIWLLYGYYIYIQIVIPAIIYWIWAAYNCYCFLCVYTQYKIIYRMSSPYIEFLYT